MNEDFITLNQIKEILADTNRKHLESLARQSARLTRQSFGRTISFYAPVQLSNYCSSHCSYCEFSNHRCLQRTKLTTEQMHPEMKRVTATGMESLLLVTGESSLETPLTYLKEAVATAKQYFTDIHTATHPMETAEYRELFQSGVQGMTCLQETYDQERYALVHREGQKKDYAYRIAAPERIARAGIRQIALGILLGLGPAAEDLLGLYRHLRWMENNFPGIDYSLCFPRLRPVPGEEFMVNPVEDITFIKIICLSRILFPHAGIHLSTCESPKIRNHAIELGVTHIAIGVNGSTVLPNKGQEPQFDISDPQGLEEIIQSLKNKNFNPILSKSHRINNISSPR